MPTRSPRTVKRLGWLLLACGLLLIGLIGTVTWRTYPSMSHPGVADASGGTFTGTPDQAKLFLTIFAGVFAFGVVAAINGVWQIVTGRRSVPLFAATVGLAALLLFLATRVVPLEKMLGG